MSPEEERRPRRIRIGRDGEDGRAPRPGLDFERHVAPGPTSRPRGPLLTGLLVVVLGIAGLAYLRNPGDDSTPAAPASVPFGPLSPSGEVDAGLVIFAWAPHPRAEGYELSLADAAGRVLWTARLARETRVALPRDVGRSLVPGGAYRWSVAALLGGGAREESRASGIVVR